MNSTRAATITVLGLRIAYGATLLAAPARLSGRWLGDDARRGGTQVALRGLGAREVIFHGGALAAFLRGRPLRPWLAGSIAGDLADIAATVTARDGLPSQSPAATALVAGGSAALSAALAVVADE
jgi:hypothetical protein